MGRMKTRSMIIPTTAAAETATSAEMMKLSVTGNDSKYLPGQLMTVTK